MQVGQVTKQLSYSLFLDVLNRHSIGSLTKGSIFLMSFLLNVYIYLLGKNSTPFTSSPEETVKYRHLTG